MRLDEVVAMQEKVMVRSEGVLHRTTKHIDIRHHWIRESAKAGEITAEWVETARQLADIFTKPLSRESFTRIRAAIMHENTSAAQAINRGESQVKAAVGGSEASSRLAVEGGACAASMSAAGGVM